MIDNSLGKFFGVLSDFGKSSCADSLQSELGLLNTKNEETDGSGINNRLSELMVVLGNARESEGSSLFNGGIEFFKAINKGVKSS